MHHPSTVEPAKVELLCIYTLQFVCRIMCISLDRLRSGSLQLVQFTWVQPIIWLFGSYRRFSISTSWLSKALCTQCSGILHVAVNYQFYLGVH